MDSLTPTIADLPDPETVNHDTVNLDAAAFEALAQPTRLAALRLLLAAGADGMAAGVLAKQLDVPHNTLSFHLSFLVKAGLATGEKQGRQMIYRARPAGFHGLIRVLAQSGACGMTEDPRTGAAMIELPPAAVAES